MTTRADQYMLLISLWIACMSGLIFQFNGLTVLLASLVLALLIWQKSLSLFLWVGLFSLIVGLYFVSHQVQLQDQVRQSYPSTGTYRGRLIPDELTVDGQQLSGLAHFKNGQTVRFFCQISSQNQQKNWQTNQQVLDFEAQGSLLALEAPSNFNQFDGQFYAKTQGITHQLQVKNWHVKPVESANFWDSLIFKLRTWHTSLLNQANQLPRPLSYYTQSLILGANSQELYADNPGISTMGLIHLFSVSGFQVNLLTSIVFAITKRLGLLYELVAGLLMVLLPLYFIFSGSPAILIRAIVAGELGLLVKITPWRINRVKIWSISLVSSLIIAPQLLLTLGGQLSFALTFGLLLVKQLTTWQRNLWLGLISFPLIVAHQFTWHILQSLVNLIAIPLFEIVIVPTVLVGYLGQGLPLISGCCNVILRIFANLIDFSATLPGNFIIGKFPWVFSIALFLVGWFVYHANRKISCGAKIIWVSLLLLGYLSVHFPYQGEFTTFDIGQGDSALIRTPWNQSVTIIDTGGKVEFGNQAPWQLRHYQRSRAEMVIVPYLHSCGIGQIDNLVLTHQDQDHIGDAQVLLQQFKVKNVIIPAGMEKQVAYTKKIKPYLGKSRLILATNQTHVDNLPLQFVHPFQAGRGENEDSLALYGQLGPNKIFTAGDLDRKGEQAIANQYPELKVDIIKFGHHGSKTATDDQVIARWQPAVGIISAGRNNRYHHPHLETLETAQHYHIGLFNTQNNGMVKYVYTKYHSHFEVKLNDEIKSAPRAN
ncbi:DNA internalization-related competence protein ComEC/Rec2 [Convivina praedatoris]|uniref:ComE operon protein 3 n=1 Tax=Convivina praedatoris TaxID=2880963 RepID=A0ABN8H704_9LACO|nr:DNA internalization-related competence protein ComEC/Rec2 [Convivina sp. LMG 32447]CAH1850473.1 ComE operon protein 3 [Convivina sp. LMG 32447]CAH1850484.1 ComE operon protein 3 [Convivina sp. LMG 32447]CAH1850732.1 ComE operon protein 3 [Convivina sp. LMG 32447]